MRDGNWQGIEDSIGLEMKRGEGAIGCGNRQEERDRLFRRKERRDRLLGQWDGGSRKCAIAIIENLFNNSGANIQFDLGILAQKILLPKI